MENKFSILKTSEKLDAVYIAREINTNKIYCIKKSPKNSHKNNLK